MALSLWTRMFGLSDAQKASIDERIQSGDTQVLLRDPMESPIANGVLFASIKGFEGRYLKMLADSERDCLLRDQVTKVREWTDSGLITHKRPQMHQPLFDYVVQKTIEHYLGGVLPELCEIGLGGFHADLKDVEASCKGERRLALGEAHGISAEGARFTAYNDKYYFHYEINCRGMLDVLEVFVPEHGLPGVGAGGKTVLYLNPINYGGDLANISPQALNELVLLSYGMLPKKDSVYLMQK